jgi:hypothetical protein
MIRNQIVTVLRKPAVHFKMAAISLLFLLNIVDQLQLLSYFAEDMGEKGTLTVAVFLCHIFNYLDFYQMCSGLDLSFLFRILSMKSIWKDSI